jgi:hypothetical protein
MSNQQRILPPIKEEIKTFEKHLTTILPVHFNIVKFALFQVYYNSNDSKGVVTG